MYDNREVSFIHAYRMLLPLLSALSVAILLFVIVRQRAKLFVAGFAGSLNLTSVFPFSSFKRDLFLMVRLGKTVTHLRARFAYEYVLGNCGHARGQGGRQPTAAKHPS